MRKTKQEKLIEYEIVKRASKGEVDAINLVFAHYESYIRKLSLRPYTDEFGMTQFFTDYELKNRLEAKLLEKILDFEAA
ncbi:MAG: helix-turn-helix domain-containing protein [Clostridiales bacterium]|nr:helix-turn-helix domain-containing protein [Clostridiales bacterium]